MGCVSSKKAKSRSPSTSDYPLSVPSNGSADFASSLPTRGGVGGPLVKIDEKDETEEEEGEEEEEEDEAKEESLKRNVNLRAAPASKKAAAAATSGKKTGFSFRFGRLIEGEHIAAGWPAWLTAVAGEAIDGMLPLRSDVFERLEKIGQGTYSSVYRARDLESGRMVALKKVRFDNFQPESIRFMAREITILRRLGHPNIMKLEGIITSRLSSTMYLVFEYMEHDLAGLLSCPDIKFSDAQVKCYMLQLLWGIEHCHSKGVIHRDIKSSNILVNNEGILKVADFGLANFMHPKNNRQPLTSRVVTLWYRPPELLLGCTNYGASVDLWSVGCVFAELFFGRPLLKGRTEVEQIHKIFKLCGSPPDDYWRKSKLTLATMFRTQHYESTLRGRCRELPKSAVNLLETFLSLEPSKRGTASSAIDSEYFQTKPYACDPSSLPKYPPNKEIDAKFREDVRRKKEGLRIRGSGGSRNPRRASKALEVLPNEEVEANIHPSRRNSRGNSHYPKVKGVTELKQSYDTVSEVSQTTDPSSQGDSVQSVPVQMSASSNFAWPKRRKPDARSTRLRSRTPISRIQSPGDENTGLLDSKARERKNLNSTDSFDPSVEFKPPASSTDHKGQPPRNGLSGPLLYQLNKTERRQESHNRQANRRSRFYRDQ